VKPAPSLLKRAALSVIASFVLVFAVLLAGIGYNSLKRETGDLDRELLDSARRFAAALDEVHDGREAATLLRIERRMMLDARDGQPPLHLFVARRDGTLRESTAGAPLLDTAALPEGVSTLDIGGTTVRAYAAVGPNWRVAIIDDHARRRRAVLAEIATDLVVYLLWALPIMLLPVWFAVRSALAPLQRLATDVGARRPDDTAPLAPARAYAELRPLVEALNGQFERSARRLQREKAFVNDAAHELRTPLAVISAQAHVLQASEGPARHEAARRLQAAVERASHLAHQLLRLAQADALALAPRETVDVMNLVRDTLAGMTDAAPQHGAEISLTGPDSAVLATDARALRSMLCNLVDNALRYGGRGVAVEVVVELDAAAWRLCVVDNGPGIAPEHRGQVFERFWRGQAEDERGAGLGLAIVREAARSLGGEVNLQPGPQGRGCRFCVKLPRT
jgi:two-component system, OmpR family, sensor histidine kinase QseC